MSPRTSVAEAGYRRLQRDLQNLGGNTETRTVGQDHKVEVEDEEELQAELAEDGARQAANVPLSELVRRFRANRLYEE